MSPITTHILDTALGKPGEGVTVTLHRVEANGTMTELARGVTDADGRVADLLREGEAAPGTYRIDFDTDGYFTSTGRESFYPRVEVLFRVDSDSEHYHVPLLLSPFGYSTYRGS